MKPSMAAPAAALRMSSSDAPPAVANVVADAVVEQHGILRDDADCGAKAGLGDFGDVLPVDGDPARGRVVEAVEQPGDRRFARARRPDDGAAGARRDDDVEAFEDFAGGLVAELDILEPDFAAADVQRLGAGRVDDFGRRVEKAEHRLHVDQALPDRAIDPAEHVERPEQLHQQAN